MNPRLDGFSLWLKKPEGKTILYWCVIKILDELNENIKICSCEPLFNEGLGSPTTTNVFTLLTSINWGLNSPCLMEIFKSCSRKFSSATLRRFSLPSLPEFTQKDTGSSGNCRPAPPPPTTTDRLVRCLQYLQVMRSQRSITAGLCTSSRHTKVGQWWSGLLSRTLAMSF